MVLLNGANCLVFNSTQSVYSEVLILLCKLDEFLKFTTLIEPTYTTQDVSEQHTLKLFVKNPRRTNDISKTIAYN